MSVNLAIVMSLDAEFTQYRVELEPNDALEFLSSTTYNLATGERLAELILELGKMIPPMQYSMINGEQNPNNGRTHHKFYVGREYSRVIYLEIVKAYMPKYWDWTTFDRDVKRLANLAMAEEFSAAHEEHSVSYRLWWD